MSNYLAKFDSETLPRLSDCVLVSGESLRFTSLGKKRYAERFARAGVDINKVRKVEAMKEALRNSASEELEAFAQYVEAKHKPGLERDWLVAAAIGTEAELAGQSSKLERRNRLGLRITGKD